MLFFIAFLVVFSYSLLLLLFLYLFSCCSCCCVLVGSLLLLMLVSFGGFFICFAFCDHRNRKKWFLHVCVCVCVCVYVCIFEFRVTSLFFLFRFCLLLFFKGIKQCNRKSSNKSTGRKEGNFRKTMKRYDTNIMSYNLGQSIWRLFHILAQFPLTISEKQLDYYHKKVNVASRATE